MSKQTILSEVGLWWGRFSVSSFFSGLASRRRLTEPFRLAVNRSREWTFGSRSSLKFLDRTWTCLLWDREIGWSAFARAALFGGQEALGFRLLYRPLSPFSSQGLFCCLQWGNEKLRSGLGGACFWEVDVFLRCIFFQSPWGLPVSFVFLLFPRIRERKTTERAEWSVDQNRLLNCTVEGPQKFSREAEFIYLRDGWAIWKRWGLWFGELPDF